MLYLYMSYSPAADMSTCFRLCRSWRRLLQDGRQLRTSLGAPAVEATTAYAVQWLVQEWYYKEGLHKSCNSIQRIKYHRLYSLQGTCTEIPRRTFIKTIFDSYLFDRFVNYFVVIGAGLWNITIFCFQIPYFFLKYKNVFFSRCTLNLIANAPCILLSISSMDIIGFISFFQNI